jgi:hypothetical protein
MGRDLSWYVIPKNIEHDKTKKICLNYEFQGDEEDVRAEVYEKVTGESPMFDYKTHDGETGKEYFKRKQAFYDNVNKVAYEYINDFDKKHMDEWCPKCHMFANGLYDTPTVLAKDDIHHSYSSLYWRSKWNIKDLYLGSSETEFVRLFRDDYYYREITAEDVERALEIIEDLGVPKRNSDIEACEETMSILNFLKKWTQQDDVIVIMEDEL